MCTGFVFSDLHNSVVFLQQVLLNDALNFYQHLCILLAVSPVDQKTNINQVIIKYYFSAEFFEIMMRRE